MTYKYTLVAALGIALLLSGESDADEIATQIKAMPGSVEEVSIVGSWQARNLSGVYRLVVVRAAGERITPRLFVQWITYGDATVSNSIEITEVGGLGVDILNLSSESDDDGLLVFIDTINETGEVGDTYELHVSPSADYVFGLASN